MLITRICEEVDCEVIFLDLAPALSRRRAQQVVATSEEIYDAARELVFAGKPPTISAIVRATGHDPKTIRKRFAGGADGLRAATRLTAPKPR